jgi:hypothetical protein
MWAAGPGNYCGCFEPIIRFVLSDAITRINCSPFRVPRSTQSICIANRFHTVIIASRSLPCIETVERLENYREVVREIYQRRSLLAFPFLIVPCTPQTGLFIIATSAPTARWTNGMPGRSSDEFTRPVAWTNVNRDGG